MFEFLLYADKPNLDLHRIHSPLINSVSSFCRAVYQKSENLSDLIRIMQGVLVSDTKLEAWEFWPQSLCFIYCTILFSKDVISVNSPTPLLLHIFRRTAMQKTDLRVPGHN